MSESNLASMLYKTAGVSIMVILFLSLGQLAIADMPSKSASVNSTATTTNDPYVLAMKPYVEGFADGALYILLLLIAIFSIKYRNRYLNTPPGREAVDSSKEQTVDQIKEEYKEWSREQNFSATLAGFSISALVFILAFKELSKLQTMVEFFSLGFILEMLSFMSYKYMVKRKYEFLGTALQFAGLLAMFNGFFVFIMSELFSIKILVIFAGGYILFFIFTWQQLGTYVSQFKISKTYSNNSRKIKKSEVIKNEDEDPKESFQKDKK